jgi:vacuolar-type H+-ATPase subunit H
MSNFKTVLEIEKRYKNQISNALSRKEKKFQQFEAELSIKESATKEDIKKEAQNDLKREIRRLENEAENIRKKAQEEAKFLEESVNKEKILNTLMEEIKNV